MAKGKKGSSPPEENKPVKTSLVINPVVMKKIRYVALNEETEISQVVDEYLRLGLAQYEKKNGEIPVK